MKNYMQNKYCGIFCDKKYLGNITRAFWRYKSPAAPLFDWKIVKKKKHINETSKKWISEVRALCERVSLARANNVVSGSKTWHHHDFHYAVSQQHRMTWHAWISIYELEMIKTFTLLCHGHIDCRCLDFVWHYNFGLYVKCNHANSIVIQCFYVISRVTPFHPDIFIYSVPVWRVMDLIFNSGQLLKCGHMVIPGTCN